MIATGKLFFSTLCNSKRSKKEKEKYSGHRSRFSHDRRVSIGTECNRARPRGLGVLSSRTSYTRWARWMRFTLTSLSPDNDRSVEKIFVRGVETNEKLDRREGEEIFGSRHSIFHSCGRMFSEWETLETKSELQPHEILLFFSAIL